MQRLLLLLGALPVLGWLAFSAFGVTFGWDGLEAAAADFEAWLYGWAAFPSLLFLLLGALSAWLARDAFRWATARAWLDRLAELHEEGVTLKNLGQTMVEATSLGTFLRGAADWEERTHKALRERAKTEAVAFRAPPSLAPPELRPKYFSDEHRKMLALHSERLGRLQRVIANRAFGLQ